MRNGHRNSLIKFRLSHLSNWNGELCEFPMVVNTYITPNFPYGPFVFLATSRLFVSLLITMITAAKAMTDVCSIDNRNRQTSPNIDWRDIGATTISHWRQNRIQSLEPTCMSFMPRHEVFDLKWKLYLAVNDCCVLYTQKSGNHCAMELTSAAIACNS